jgi:hypothetical protein
MEERHMGGHAAPRSVRGVEGIDVIRSIAAGRPQQADSGFGRASEVDDVVVDRRGQSLFLKPAASDGQDPDVRTLCVDDSRSQGRPVGQAPRMSRAPRRYDRDTTGASAPLVCQALTVSSTIGSGPSHSESQRSSLVQDLCNADVFQTRRVG